MPVSSQDLVLHELCSLIARQLARDRSYYDQWSTDWMQLQIEAQLDSLPDEPRDAEIPPLTLKLSGRFECLNAGGLRDDDWRVRMTEPFVIELCLSAEKQDVPDSSTSTHEPRFHFSGHYDGSTLELRYRGRRPNRLKRTSMTVEVPPGAADLLANAPHVSVFVVCGPIIH